MAAERIIPTITGLQAAAATFGQRATFVAERARIDLETASDLNSAAQIALHAAGLRRAIAEEAALTVDPDSANRLRDLLAEEL
jgi:hypothetical protein